MWDKWLFVSQGKRFESQRMCGEIGCGLNILKELMMSVDGTCPKASPFLFYLVYESVQKYLQRLIVRRNYIFRKFLNIHSAFSIGNRTASPRYIEIGIPKVK